MVTGVLKTGLAVDVIVPLLCKLLKLSAVEREWVRGPERFDKACQGGTWKGPCLFVVRRGRRTLVENLSGCLGALTARQWQALAASSPFTYLEYNDGIPYAQYVRAKAGKLVDYYLFDGDDRKTRGRKFTSWVEIASVVDDDEDLFLEESEGDLFVLAPIPTAPRRRK